MWGCMAVSYNMRLKVRCYKVRRSGNAKWGMSTDKKRGIAGTLQ